MKLKPCSRSLTISSILLILVGFLFAYPLSLSASSTRQPTGVASGAGTPIQSPATQRNTPPGLADAAFVSHADATDPISVVVMLDLRDHAGVNELIEAQQDPASPLYHQWIAPEEFQSRFGPLPTDLQATRDFLAAQGFTNISQPTSTMIAADGNVALAERAFQVTINNYTYNGRSVYSNDRDPILPGNLASKVAHVGGLENLAVAFPNHHAERLIDPDYVFNGSNYMMSRDSQVAYGEKAGYFDAGKKGTPGAELAIASSFDIQLSDVNDQLTRQGGAAAGYNVLTSASSGAHTVSSTCVPNTGSGTGCTFVNGAGHSSLETIWDVSLSSSVANDNHIGVYLAQNQLTTSFGVVYQYLADRAGSIKVVSHSWGLCLSLMSTGVVTSDDNAFAQAAAGGQAWFVATGDAGSNDCNGQSGGANPDVDYPASSPYVTGAGGSEQNQLAAGTFGADGWLAGYPPNGESACSNGGGGQATAGVTEPRPSWQTGTGVPAGTKRLVPDISMHYGQCGSPGNGKPYLVMIGGSVFTSGGTSGDAPQWAGYWAVGNQVITQAGGSLGQAAPLMFRILRNEAGTSYANSFHDLTTGSNGAFSATVGYDQATGVGTPKWNNLYTDLAKFFAGATTRTLTVASSNPSSGVSITVSPNDNNGQGSGVTQFTRTYNNNASVTLTAPSTASGNSFSRWQRDGVDFAFTVSTNVTMDANHTMTAVYLGAQQPDLTVTSLTAPTTGSIGGQITVATTVVNQGSAAAGAFRVGFYLSTDNIITTGDTFTGWGCTYPSGLAAGASTSCDGPVGIPSSLPPGTYFFGAIADDLGAVAESNEANNSRAADTGPIVLTSQGQGTCASPYNIVRGHPFNGNTSGGQSVFASYSCVGWSESGPERVHTITLASSGTLTASLSNLGGNDLDVFILSSCSSGSCLAFGDNTASASVGPGTYYILVDGFEGAVGGYTLTVGNTAFDFDGDGKSDVSVFRPSTGTWFIVNSSNGSSTTVGWGQNGDKPVAGDYDGDGKTDIAIWRPSTGVWWIRNSSNGSTTMVGWGVSSDVPAPADYDGDGKTDIAVWRPATGTWFIIKSSNGAPTTVVWGTSGDKVAPADYDGDGKADVAIFRPSTGTWFIINSSNSSITNVGWGQNGDIPVAADYDGDGKTDIAIWRPSTGVWWIRKSSNGSTSMVGWGISTDVPVPADYDGDGKSDNSVWRTAGGFWLIINSSSGSPATVVWGTNGDIPISARS